MVRLRDSWPFSLSSAPTVGNPCRRLQPESVSLLSSQDIAGPHAGTQAFSYDLAQPPSARLRDSVRLGSYRKTSCTVALLLHQNCGRATPQGEAHPDGDVGYAAPKVESTRCWRET